MLYNIFQAMQQVTNRIRKPVRREGAERYLLWTLLSFATSVSITRLFLDLTGYPQLGSESLHISHVLWGGLLLYAASLIPLLYANRWVYIVSAVLSGIGIGLFIDEVGKFITQTNNYFYPPAAPIVYAFFLISVLIYIRSRSPRKHDIRQELYSALESLEEVLDHDLSPIEQQKLVSRLNSIAEDASQADLQRLAFALRDFAVNDAIYLAPERLGWIDRWLIRLQAFEEKHLSRTFYRVFLAVSLFGASIWSLYYPVLMTIYLGEPSLFRAQAEINRLIQDQLVLDQFGLNWFEARLALQGLVGLILLSAVLFIIVRQEKRGLQLGYMGLLLSLTTVNLLVFYFDQFSSLAVAFFQAALFLLLLHYRRKYNT